MNVCVWGQGIEVWMGVGRPCPPVCNNIVTPRHPFLSDLLTMQPCGMLFFLELLSCYWKYATALKGGQQPYLLIEYSIRVRMKTCGAFNGFKPKHSTQRYHIREGHGWWHFDKNVPIIDWTPRLSNLMIFWTNSTVQFNFSQNLEKRRPYFDKTSNREKLRK